jgi:hypothetical protein
MLDASSPEDIGNLISGIGQPKPTILLSIQYLRESNPVLDAGLRFIRQRVMSGCCQPTKQFSYSNLLSWFGIKYHALHLSSEDSEDDTREPTTV